MKETIILTPGLNSNEMLQSLAFYGTSCINLRICGAGELARMAMMRSGIAITEEFIDRREEISLMSEAVQGEEYFKNPTYSDIKEITDAIRCIRALVAEENESTKIEEILGKGPFKKKNDALVSVYKKFMGKISEGKKIDSVSLVRRATIECWPIDADFVILEEYPLSPLEKALVDKLSDGKAQKKTIRELFKGAVEKPLKITSLRNCYGAANEVETILAEIYSSKQLDKCTVAVTDTSTYAQLFFDYALLYDMPISFGCGIPIVNSNPAKLLSLYYRWMTSGFFGATALSDMISSPAFNKSALIKNIGLDTEKDKEFHWKTFTGLLGGIRFGIDKRENQKRLENFKRAIEEELAETSGDEKSCKDLNKKKHCLPYLEKIADEFALSAAEFMRRYSYIRRGNATNSQKILMLLDNVSLGAICDELSVIESNASAKITAEELIPNILKKNVAYGRSEMGKLFVTGIDGAITSIRENLYIAGLSSSKYPGSPKENPLLLDTDLDEFGPGISYLKSDGRINQKRERLFSLVGLASSLGVNINVSFAGLNVSELKKDNASSLVFELYKKSNGTDVSFNDLENKIKKVKYFDPSISQSRNIGKAYNDEKNINAKKRETRSPVTAHIVLGKYSPSALDKFFKCPKSFMFKYILGIPEPDDDNPFEVIGAADNGTLAHSLMEKLSGSGMSLEAFLKLSEEYFNRFILEHPALLPRKVDIERKNFLDMMETAYKMDPHRIPELKEKDIGGIHESGIEIHGFPDCVEKMDDGSCLIVDYKTKRKKEHEKDDIDSCLQIVIYAYLMEKMGCTVSGGEFRYFKLGQSVSCKYDAEMKQRLADKLNLFKHTMETANFETPKFDDENQETETCKYCKYGTICGKVSYLEDDDE